MSTISVYVKIMAFILALVFVSGCAVYVRDTDDWHYHHHGYWHWHSSVPPSPGLTDHDLLAKNNQDHQGANLGS